MLSVINQGGYTYIVDENGDNILEDLSEYMASKIVQSLEFTQDVPEYYLKAGGFKEYKDILESNLTSYRSIARTWMNSYNEAIMNYKQTGDPYDESWKEREGAEVAASFVYGA